MLPLPVLAERRERADCQLADPLDGRQPQLGLWPVLTVPAQRKELRMEPQTDLPHLPRIGAKPVHQTQKALGAR